MKSVPGSRRQTAAGRVGGKLVQGETDETPTAAAVSKTPACPFHALIANGRFAAVIGWASGLL